MTNLLLKIFVKNHKNTTDFAVRENVGKLSGIVCIILNSLLAAAKISVGILFSTVSVLADGINNLTDCGSNVVSFIGIKLANKPADGNHPFGHRRMEYIASMIVGFSVVVLALETGAQSVSKTILWIKGEQTVTDVGIWTFATLSVSLVVKFWMFLFNNKLGKTYSSELLKATAIDSISDVLSTAAVLVALIVSRFANVNLDGIMGIVVSVFVAVAGLKILKSTVNELIGEAPSEEMIDSIVSRVKSYEGVLGVHDVNVHNYGPDKFYATVHVEVDASVNVCQSHDLLDKIERDFAQNTDIVLVTHLDPIVVGDPILDEYKREICEIVEDLDKRFSVHDFRAVKGAERTTLIFDVAVPYDVEFSEKQIIDDIQRKIFELHPCVFVAPTVEQRAELHK